MRQLPLLLATVLLLAACSPIVDSDGDIAASSSTSSKASVATYTGIVQPAGISIYQQGTHRLELSDGRFVLLESDSVNLNRYIGQRVQLVGTAQATVEAGGTIVSVLQLTLADDAESSRSSSSESAMSSSSSSSSSLISSSSSESSQTSSSSSVTSSSLSSSVSSVAATRSSVSSSSSVVSSSSSSAEAASVDLAAQAAAMAKQNLAADQWTQEYCSQGYSFCIPVHRNWWYKSFLGGGGIISVELSTKEIEQPGSGPIVVVLKSGSLADVSATDGEVRAEGDMAVGYRSWTDGRYFMVSAPSNLSAAVRLLTERISAR